MLNNYVICSQCIYRNEGYKFDDVSGCSDGKYIDKTEEGKENVTKS